MKGSRFSAFLFVLALVAGAAGVCLAQVPPPPPPPPQEEPAPEPQDEPPAEGRRVPLAPGPPVSPRGAFFRSLVLPGWGQAYVGAPGRGAVYFSLAAGSVWMSYVARRQLGDARAQQEWLRETGQIGPAEETSIAISREEQFEDWAALSVFLFFLSGADAYVAAYLSDFDERIGVRRGENGAMRFEARIPLDFAR